MIKIREIDHLVIRANNPEVMVSFYCDVLGCVLEKTQSKFGLFQLRAGQSIIDIVAVDGQLGKQGGAGPARQGRNLDHFCLRIEPFNEAQILAHLASFSITPGASQSRYGAEGSGPSIYIEDPEQNVIELKGAPDIS